MLLSQTAEYALRAMAWLAHERPTGAVRARDLSEGTGIPLHYLSKILRRLVVGGLLDSRKGKGGGFSLARPPETIRFEDVLLAVDAYPEQGHCAFGWDSCGDARPCPLHDTWTRLSDAVHAWASNTTLASIRHEGGGRVSGP